MNKEESLAGEFAGAAVADLAEPALGHADAGAVGLGAAAPVRDPVDAADRVGSEAVDRAGASGPGWGRGADEVLGSGGGEEEEG